MRFHNCVHYALVFLCGLVERSVRRWCTLKLLMVTWSSYNKILLLFQSPKKSSLKHWREKMSLLKREREREQSMKNGRTYLFRIDPTWQRCKHRKDIQFGQLALLRLAHLCSSKRKQQNMYCQDCCCFYGSNHALLAAHLLILSQLRVFHRQN